MDQKSKEARLILNRILAELVVASRSFDFSENLAEVAGWSDMTIAATNSTNMNSVILALCKWVEFYHSYAQTIPGDFTEENRKLKKTLDRLEIVDFRNKFIGHIVDRKTKSPLSVDEANEYYNKITGGNRKQFLRWLNDPKSNNDIVGLFERTRDSLQ